MKYNLKKENDLLEVLTQNYTVVAIDGILGVEIYIQVVFLKHFNYMSSP